MFQFFTFLVLLAIGWLIGRMIEKRHLARLAEGERACAAMLVTNLKTFPNAEVGRPAKMVMGHVVIGSDYFKAFLAMLRFIIGGEVNSFRLILERARREALLRMLQSAAAQGFDAVCNIRLECSNLGGGEENAGRFLIVEVLAYGTAYHSKRQAVALGFPGIPNQRLRAAE